MNHCENIELHIQYLINKVENYHYIYTIIIMPNKSLLQITQPRETYVDGYGAERTFDEPKVITNGRKM